MSDQQFEENNSPLIGDIIRQAREKKNVSVKIVAQHTKISSTNLEALEANDLASLPNKAYVKGYVKSCAKLLNLNENDCLNILQANYDALEKPHKLKAEKQQEKINEVREGNELLLKMVGVVAVIVIIVLVMSRQDSSTPEPIKEEVAETIEENQTEVEVNVDVTPVVLSDSTPLEEKVVATPTPAPTPTLAPTPAPTPIAKEKSEEKDKIDLRPITGTLYDFDREMSKDQIDEYLPANFRTSDDGKQHVFITASEGETWLTYQADGGDIKKFILRQGQKLLISGEEVLLFLGNYRATKIFLNNRPLSINSRTGVKSLVFPQEKANEHFYPLFIYKDDGSVMNSKTYKQQNN